MHRPANWIHGDDKEGSPAPERRERARARLDAVGLAARAAHRPDRLSGGERERAALARGTVHDPRVLLADEPTGNLDSASGRQILEILQRMNADGLTLLVVTQDPAVARRAGRVLVLQDGRIVTAATARTWPRPCEP